MKRSRRPAAGPAGTPIDRRRFLALAGTAAAWTVLHPVVTAAPAWARRLATVPVPLQPWWLPAEAPLGALEQARALIGAAVLAPSHWNTQPWRFEVEGESVRLLLDPSRALPVLDPDQRHACVALGAALENLLVAARAWGLRTSVRYLPADRGRGVLAEVTWTPGDPRRDHALFPYIVRRRTNRLDYDGRAILMEHAAQLTAQASDGVRVHWLDDRAGIRALGDVAHDATRATVLYRRAEAERFAWLRLDGQQRKSGDGISPEALAIGLPARWLVGRTLESHSALLRFGAGSLAHQARDTVRSSGAVALLTTATRGEAAWLAAGQAWERIALKATQLDIAHQPMQAMIEHPGARAETLHRFGAAGEEPLLFVRLGHARRVPPSPRRGVPMVASFRQS
jgi:hypothetical protein